MKKLFLILQGILCVFTALCQDNFSRKVIKYSLRDGLSFGFVNGVTQDDNGLMWFATSDGLNRFDGVNFKVFKHDAANPFSLPGNYIDIMFKDQQGVIWLSTRRGIYNFDINTERFSKFQPDKNQLINNVSCFAPGGKNLVWLSSYGAGFFSYNKINHQFKNYNVENLSGLRTNKSNSIFQDSKGWLWIGENGISSVYKVNNDAIVANLSNHIPINTVPIGRVSTIIEDRYSNVWIATSQGMAVYERQKNKFHVFDAATYHLRSNYFFSLLTDNHDNLLIGLQDGGLYKLNLTAALKANFHNVAIEPVKTDDNKNITERTIQSLFLDKDKNVWAGTFGDGLYLLANAPEKFKKFQTRLADANSSGYLRYYGMCRDADGNLWLGTDGDGIYKKDLNGNVIKHYYADGKNGSLTSNAILTAFMDSDHNLYFGSYDRGLFKYDKKADAFINYAHRDEDKESLCGNDVRVIFEDAQNNIWIGTNGGGISEMPKGKSSFINFGEASISTNIRAICQDNNGNLYFGSYGWGLIRYDKSIRKFSRFFSHKLIDSILPGRVIYSLKSLNNKLLIGTEADGLVIYNLETKSIQQYNEENGLANGTINAIQVDGDGDVWVSTNRGISKIEKSTGNVLNYNTSDGLQSGHFSPGSSFYNNEEKYMCFGGTEGYNVFYPEKVKKSGFKPKVIITGLQLFNKDIEVGEKDHILSKEINKSTQIVLQPDQSVFSIQYVALNYAYADKSEFAYRLQGLDKTWNYVQSQKSATYRYLPPGDYVFEVRASNQDGVWFADYASINIKILPPWYKTWYAYLIYALALLSIMYYYVRFRRKQDKLKYDIKIAQLTAEKEKELNERKLSFFTNISHEYRTPLTLIINPVKELISNKNQSAEDLKNLHVVHRNARRLLSLVDQLLLFRKAESEGDKLKIVKLDIVNLSKEVFLCFNYQATVKKIQFSLNSASDAIEIYADREKLEIALFNLVSNALKFTPIGGNIDINITEDVNFINIQVLDSGCGVPKDVGDKLFDRFYQVQHASLGNGGFGIGLYLVKTFIESQRGTISYESEEGEGTVFNIQLLKGKRHFGNSFIFEDVDEHSAFLDELMNDEPITQESATSQNAPLNNYEALLSSKKVMLIIEDNIQIREYLVQIFNGSFEVFELGNANEGYNTAVKLMPNIIISDVMMNGLSGIDLCSQLKGDPSLNYIPFILLTANTMPETKVEGIECGADDYITKPFEKEELVARVNGLVKNRENLQNYFYNEITLKSNNLKVSTEYKEFLEKCIAVVESHLEDDQFGIKILADEIGMSHSNLYKKIKAVSGGSANEFIRYIRLRKAAEIMLNTDCTVAEAAYKVGLNNAKYFREQFSKLFGVNPSDYIKKFREPFAQAGKHNSKNK